MAENRETEGFTFKEEIPFSAFIFGLVSIIILCVALVLWGNGLINDLETCGVTIGGLVVGLLVLGLLEKRKQKPENMEKAMVKP